MPSMYEIYKHYAAEYDRLLLAEDHLGNLPRVLHQIVDWRGRSVLEAGAGTGRVTALYASQAQAITCVDREAHMLDAARRRLASHSDKVRFVLADDLDMPVLTPKAQVFIEGWCWGHSVVDAEDSVEETVRTLVRGAVRNLRSEAQVVLIETLGTGSDEPTPPDPRLGRFYEILRTRFGLDQVVVTTDYRFGSVAAAAETLGFFFGPVMKLRIEQRNWSIVPEWTGIWYGRLDPGADAR